MKARETVADEMRLEAQLVEFGNELFAGLCCVVGHDCVSTTISFKNHFIYIY